MRLSEAITLFREHSSLERSASTTQGYYGDLMRFCLYMRNPPILQIAPEHVVGYLRESLELGWKRNSLVSTSIALRKFFEYWRRKGYTVLDYQVLPVIHKEGVEPKVASAELVLKLLAQCEGPSMYAVRNRAIVLLLLDTGMRGGELCQINVQDLETVEAQDGQYSCVIRNEKNRGSKPHRRVFWYQETNDALNRWLLLRAEFVRMFPVKDPDAIFLGVKSAGVVMGKRFSSSKVAQIFRDLSADAQIPTINPHSLRHKFGMDAALQGANNSNISDLLGHVRLDSSFVYTHLKGKELGNAHRKVKNKGV